MHTPVFSRTTYYYSTLRCTTTIFSVRYLQFIVISVDNIALLDTICASRFTIIGILGPSADYSSTGYDVRKMLRLFGVGLPNGGGGVIKDYELFLEILVTHVNNWKRLPKIEYQERQFISTRIKRSGCPAKLQAVSFKNIPVTNRNALEIVTRPMSRSTATHIPNSPSECSPPNIPISVNYDCASPLSSTNDSLLCDEELSPMEARDLTSICPSTAALLSPWANPIANAAGSPQLENIPTMDIPPSPMAEVSTLDALNLTTPTCAHVLPVTISSPPWLDHSNATIMQSTSATDSQEQVRTPDLELNNDSPSSAPSYSRDFYSPTRISFHEFSLPNSSSPSVTGEQSHATESQRPPLLFNLQYVSDPTSVVDLSLKELTAWLLHARQRGRVTKWSPLWTIEPIDMRPGEFPIGYQCFRAAFQNQVLEGMRMIQIPDEQAVGNKRICVYGCTRSNSSHLWISNAEYPHLFSPRFHLSCFLSC